MSALDRRRRALEAAFFGARDARLREALRRRGEEGCDAEALARACGMEAEGERLALLVRQGVTAETLPALFLVPLVAVAWADESLSGLERREILSHAGALGIEPGSPSHRLLERWLAEPPEPALFEAWQGYARALAERVDDEQRAEIERELLWRARAVARAEGGVMCIGRRISAAEHAILDRLAQALRGS